MERLPDGIFLKFNPNTLSEMRGFYNLDKPGQMDEAVDILNEWIKKQGHFTRTDFSRDYLERLIIMMKGSVERVKAQMDKICTLRTLLPHFFDKFNVKNDYQDLQGQLLQSFLPKLTREHNRIYMQKYFPDIQYNSKKMYQMYCFNILASEFMIANDYHNGIVSIIDFRDVNIAKFITAIDLTDLRHMSTIAMEGYNARVKSLYFISTSKTIDVLVKIMKQIVSEKLGNRIVVVRSIDELCTHVQKELLPSDYGGNEKSFQTLNDEFLDILSTEETVNYFKEMSGSRTNESARDTSKFNEQYLGMAGTFRTLNFD